jgi:hypothetical protein
MDAPTCKLCGERHWSRLCEPVTRTVTVTARVTCQECEQLRAEVARLKVLLADANGVKPLAMTGAERVKKLRAKRKAGGSP